MTRGRAGRKTLEKKAGVHKAWNEWITMRTRNRKNQWSMVPRERCDAHTLRINTRTLTICIDLCCLNLTILVLHLAHSFFQPLARYSRVQVLQEKKLNNFRALKIQIKANPTIVLQINFYFLPVFMYLLPFVQWTLLPLARSTHIRSEACCSLPPSLSLSSGHCIELMFVMTFCATCV